MTATPTLASDHQKPLAIGGRPVDDNARQRAEEGTNRVMELGVVRI